MGDPLSDAGAYASFAGVGIAVFLAGLIYFLDKRRRTQEETHYKTLTEQNLQEILRIFTTVVMKSKAENMTEAENESITIELDEYFKDNYRKIRDLMRDTEIYLGQWRGSKPEQKAIVKKVIGSLNWLIETFYPLDKPEMVKRKRWIQNRVELSSKKDEVQRIVNTILEQAY